MRTKRKQKVKRLLRKEIRDGREWQLQDDVNVDVKKKLPVLSGRVVQK